jgi:hypothetical protein
MTASKPRVFSGEGSAVDDYFNAKSTASTSKSSQNQKPNWGYFDTNNSQHKRIQANLRVANIVVKSQKWGEVADMLGWFDRFLKSDKSPIKKPLKKMTQQEVSKIIVALDGVVIWKNSI